VTAPDPSLPKARREVARESLGLAAILLGLVGLAYVAYQVDPLLLLALLSTLTVLLGLRLTTRTEE
jgi:hypothetical protein